LDFVHPFCDFVQINCDSVQVFIDQFFQDKQKNKMARRKKISDLDRQRIVNSYSAGQSAKSISEVLGIGKSAIYAVLKIYKQENRVEAKKRGGHQTKKLSDEHKQQIKSWVDENCSLTLRKIKQRCFEAFGITASPTTINRCLDEFHYSLKRVSVIPSRRNDEEALNVRANYACEFLQLLSTTPHNNILFMDEVGFSVSMRTTRGRAPRGSRAVQVVPCLRSRNISVLCVMNKCGILFYSVQARPFNTITFIEALTRLFQGLGEAQTASVVVVMDNVPFHRAQGVQTIFSEFGHSLNFLPPYSPFLNPIENLFSKWKMSIRQSAPRNEEELFSLIHSSSRLITTEDCDGFF
jgi:transposase